MNPTVVRDFFFGKRVGVVLSGGGSRGFAHLGVLRFLEEIEVHPEVIAASSAGALVAVCIAAGKSSKEIGEYFLKNNIMRKSLQLSTKGVLDAKKVVEQVLAFAKVKDFSDLSIPIKVNAMDINTGRENVFSSGDLFSALQATISLPLVCFPAKVGSSFYVDGSVLDVVPVHLLPPVDITLTIDVSLPPLKISPSSNQIAVVSNMVIFSQRRNLFVAEAKKSDHDIFVRVPLQGFSLLEYASSSHKKMMEKGYVCGKQKIYNFLKELK
jgi:NTE family protein